MKRRTLLALTLLTLILTACNFSLAEDITPPPGYVSPTPAPTLEPAFPKQPPVAAAGASIFMEKCAPCHGTTGLGDGQQGSQLTVPVPGLGLPDVAAPARPADWFAIVKQGRIERFMPPFSGSLSDQQIWDVVAYAFTLSTRPEQIAEGKTLFAANCAECHGETGAKVATADFTSQSYMAARSLADFTRAIRNGASGMPAFSDLSDSQALALAAYLRTLSFAQSPAAAALSTPTAEPVATATPAAVEETPAAESTPSAESSTPVAESTLETVPTEPGPTLGTVKGVIAMASGQGAPAGLEVTLHVFDHGNDPNASPVEILTQTTQTGKDGTFTFEGIQLVEGRFYYADTPYQGITYQTDVAVSEAGASEIDLGTATLYETTSDLSGLTLDQFHMFFDFSQSGTLTVFQVFIMSNTSDKTVTIESDLTSIPFVPLPVGALNFGIESGDGPFMGTETGFAMPPSPNQYQLQIFFSLPYDKKTEITQPFALTTKSGSVIVPQGVRLDSKTLVGGQPQDIGGQQYTVYKLAALKPGDTVTFSLSGVPGGSSSPVSDLGGNTGILIGIGALGVALILAGVILYLRDRNAKKEVDLEEDDELDDENTQPQLQPDPDALMDAIIALDDQYRNGNISKEAYEQRRAELKAQLKDLL